MAYASFYNPLNFVRALWKWNDPLMPHKAMYQIYGMLGMVKSLKASFGWVWSLYTGPVKKMTGVPKRRLLMVPPPVSPEMVRQPQLQPV
jgi:hypothetical protein